MEINSVTQTLREMRPKIDLMICWFVLAETA